MRLLRYIITNFRIECYLNCCVTENSNIKTRYSYELTISVDTVARKFFLLVTNVKIWSGT